MVLISNNPEIIKYINDRLNLELCIRAVETDPNIIIYTTYENEYMRDISYEHNNNNIKYFNPDPDITNEEIDKYMNKIKSHTDTKITYYILEFIYSSINKIDDIDKKNNIILMLLENMINDGLID